MTKRVLILLALAAGLSSCASIPTEYSSPCACNYQPINIEKTDKGVV